MISKFIEKRMLNMLDEWYSAMSKRKMNHVCTLKEKIDQHLPKIKKNTKLWMRYQLFQAAISCFLKTRTDSIHCSMTYMAWKTKWMMN